MQTKSKPKISLLITSYNRPEFIREAVLSCIANQSQGVEIIVGDDASPKKHEVFLAIQDLVATGQVQYISHPINRGWSRNRNSLVDAAKGHWVILMGDDDRLKIGSLNKILWWIDNRPGYDVYAFGYDVIDSRGSYVHTRAAPKILTYQIYRGNEWKELFYADAIQHWSHHPFTMAIKRAVAIKNPFDEGAGIADDTLFQLRLLAKGGSIFVIPESLFEWRFAVNHDGRYSNLSSDNSRCRSAHRMVWLLLVKDDTLPQQVKALIQSPKWLCRFLRIPYASAKRISAIVATGNLSSDASGNPELGANVVGSKSLLGGLGRTIRVYQIFGWVHILNVARYIFDRHIYQRRRAEQLMIKLETNKF